MNKKPASRQAAFLRDVLEQNVKAVAEHEDAVRIQCDVSPARVVLTAFVAPSDMGLVLGEGGATADAMRRIVWTACKKTDFRCDIDFVANRR